MHVAGLEFQVFKGAGVIVTDFELTVLGFGKQFKYNKKHKYERYKDKISMIKHSIYNIKLKTCCWARPCNLRPGVLNQGK